MIHLIYRTRIQKKAENAQRRIRSAENQHRCRERGRIATFKVEPLGDVFCLKHEFANWGRCQLGP